MSIKITKARLSNFLREKPPTLEKKETLQFTPAAVLMLILEEAKELMVLFTERTKDLKNHGGQISFPGGRMEKSDSDLRETALRETQEEIGVAAHQINIIGSLDPVISTTGFRVTPFVGLVSSPLQMTLDPSEVAAVFTVPLNFLLDPKNQKSENYFFKGKNRQIFIIEYQEHRIWGMTAKILVDLSRQLLK